MHRVVLMARHMLLGLRDKHYVPFFAKLNNLNLSKVLMMGPST